MLALHILLDWRQLGSNKLQIYRHRSQILVGFLLFLGDLKSPFYLLMAYLLVKIFFLLGCELGIRHFLDLGSFIWALSLFGLESHKLLPSQSFR